MVFPTHLSFFLSKLLPRRFHSSRTSILSPFFPKLCMIVTLLSRKRNGLMGVLSASDGMNFLLLGNLWCLITFVYVGPSSTVHVSWQRASLFSLFVTAKSHMIPLFTIFEEASFSGNNDPTCPPPPPCTRRVRVWSTTRALGSKL